MRREASGLRVVALCLPELPLQRARRLRSDDRDGPLAVVAEGRVAHCDDAAAGDGVRRGGTVSEALAACGRLRTVALDPAADVAALRAVAESMLLLAPSVEPCAPDVILLDASAARLLAGDAEAIASAASLASARPRPAAAPLAGTTEWTGSADRSAARAAPGVTAGERVLARRAIEAAAEMGYAARAVIATGRA